MVGLSGRGGLLILGEIIGRTWAGLEADVGLWLTNIKWRLQAVVERMGLHNSGQLL